MNWPDYAARLTRVTLDRFRGFVKRRTLDVDADIVLIDGGNGFGKSSLLEAIQLLLTSRAWHEVEELVSRNATGQAAGTFCVSAQVATQAARDGKAWIKVSGPTGEIGFKFQATEDSGNNPDESGWTVSPDGPPAIARRLGVETDPPGDRELDRRVCSFHPEHLGEVLDEGSRGASLVALLTERGKWQEALRAVFGESSEWFDRVRHLEDLAADLEVNRPPTGDDRDSPDEQDINGPARDIATRTLALLREVHGLGWLTDVLHERWQRSVGDEAALPPTTDLLRQLASNTDAPGEHLLFAWQDTLARTESEHSVRAKDEPAKRLEELLRGIYRHRWSAEISPSESRALRRERHAVVARLEEIGREVAQAREDVADLQDLLDTASTIAARASAWSAALERKSDRSDFSDLAREVNAIRIETTQHAAAELAAFLEARRRLLEEQARLEERLAEVDRKLQGDRETELQRQSFELAEEIGARWQPYVRVMRWQQAEQERRTQVQALRSAVSAFHAVSDVMRNLQPRKLHEIVQAELQRRLETYRAIFHFAGSRDLQLTYGLKNRFDLTTDDGRGIRHFSTGQKAVAGVSYIVAQHTLLRRVSPRLLWHDVLLLDDVSTAYDLNNLTREALLWRHLAYRPKNPVQIFLCSHHDDLTHGLLDLLAPPNDEQAGRRLRMVVHRFKGWSQEKGPDITSFEVEPTGRLDNGGRRAFADDLERFLA